VNNSEDYKNLREQLNLQTDWPVLYMFKFILPSSNKNIALVESKFSDEAVISQKESSNGKYISITIKEVMLDADSIVAKYQEMSSIEGLMAF
jgi:putative lipoic acid-binding regulatory protein